MSSVCYTTTGTTFYVYTFDRSDVTRWSDPVSFTQIKVKHILATRSYVYVRTKCSHQSATLQHVTDVRVSSTEILFKDSFLIENLKNFYVLLVPTASQEV